MPNVQNTPRIELLGHRGVMQPGIRENSLQAFEQALEDGCTGIETDVRRTSDGALILHHDRVLPNGQAISNSTVKDCAAGLGCRPALLEEALEQLDDCLVNLEIKSLDVLLETPKLTALAEKFGKVLFSSFNHAVLVELKRHTDIPVLALTASLPASDDDFIEYVEKHSFDGVVWDYEILDHGLVGKLRQVNKINACYGLENRREVEVCDALGIGYAIVDGKEFHNRGETDAVSK